MGRFHRVSSLLPPVVAALAVSFTMGRASAPSADRPDPAAASKGGLIYQRYCTSCHGLRARGDGPVAPELRTRVPDLTTIAARHHGAYPFERVVRVIEGRETARLAASADMPAWAEVFGKTRGTETPSPDVAINDLAHYIWSLQSVQADAPGRGLPTADRTAAAGR